MKLNYNLRAIKLFHSFSPFYFPVMLLYAFFCNLSPYFNIYLSAEIINELMENRSLERLKSLVVITVLGNFVIIIMREFILRLFHHCEYLLSQKELLYFTERIVLVDYCKLETPYVRQLRRKINESSKINKHGRQLLLDSISRIMNSTIGTLMAIMLCIEMFIKSIRVVSPWIIMIFIVVMILLIIINIAYNFKVKEKNSLEFSKVSQSMIENNRVDNAIDCYNMGKDIRIYNQYPLIMDIRERSRLSHLKAFDKFSLYQFKSSLPLLAIVCFSNISIYSIVIISAILGAFGVGNIVKYIGLSQKLNDNFLSIFRGISDLKSNTKFIEDYLNYCDITEYHKTKNKICRDSLLRKEDNYLENTIEFKNVSFKYPSSNNWVIKNINLRINANVKLGIVGQNGSGKSTFIKLLSRLYAPTEGTILFNGVDIKEIDYNDYISKISVVFQDFKLFSFGLGENIAVNDDYDELKVWHALEKTEMDKKFKKGGLETHLYKDFDQDGVELSGGEAQRIALSRAVYKNASIIILDEPTASLDPITEHKFYSNFNKITKNKTAIYISHRIYSCKFCDEIVVFDDGEIVQHGTHNELIGDKMGKYYELYNAQAQYYRD